MQVIEFVDDAAQIAPEKVFTALWNRSWAHWDVFALVNEDQPQIVCHAVLVNDIHSQLNATDVESIVTPTSLAEIQELTGSGKPICVAGGRHAMGGQQFATGGVLLDTRLMKRVLRFDADRGLIELEAGMQWPELIEYLIRIQEGRSQSWGIAQKQTGADRFSIGGSIAANVHGRGLLMKPIIADVESLVLVDSRGNLRTCSRHENAELFRLVVGGYGLFGIAYSVKLRLVPRQKLQRCVEVIDIEDLMGAFDRRIADGFTYGDFQYSIDEKSETFLRSGVFSCYRPVDPSTPIPTGQKELGDEDWRDLLYLAHVDRAQVYEKYVGYYLATNGQIYWSDTHQLSTYLDDYHRHLDQTLGAKHPATEIITEIYVPRDELTGFIDEARVDFRKNGVLVIYGTIRLIERDEESFLAWAKEPYACVIFNLHTEHTREGLQHSAQAFRRLIDMAIRRGGSYYLTYHKYATREQLLACYPQFPEFLRLKRQYDPEERFQSDWYRHHRAMFKDA